MLSGRRRMIWSNITQILHRVKVKIAGLGSLLYGGVIVVLKQSWVPYLFSYFGVIGLCAVAYTIMGSSSFYDPYIRREKVTIETERGVNQLFWNLILEQYASARIADHRVMMSPDGQYPDLFGVYNLNVPDNYTIDFQLVAKWPSSIAVCTENIRLSLIYSHPMALGYDVIVDNRVLLFTELNPSRGASTNSWCAPTLERIFTTYIYRDETDKDPVVPINVPVLVLTGLVVTPDAIVYLDRFARGERGDPAYVDAYFERMLYYSATVITTTGFGDIVPISRRARALSGFEAVAGWIIAGLFLHSIGEDLRKAASKRKDDDGNQ